MLTINDLTTSKELDSMEMAGVCGGRSELESLSALIDFSTKLHNTVADVNQSFGLSVAQGNSGAVTNNQNIIGGNGIVFAPVTQTQTQGNTLAISEIGKALLG